MADNKSKAAADSDAEEKPAAKKKVEIITVKSKLKKDANGGEPVALSESNPDHPEDGEAFVYGDKEFKVARTALVSRKLAEGTIQEV